jgi:hypothetical protein
MKSFELAELNFQLRNGIINGPEDIDNWTADKINKDEGIHFKGSVSFFKIKDYNTIDDVLKYINSKYKEVSYNFFELDLIATNEQSIKLIIEIKDNFFELIIDGQVLFDKIIKIEEQTTLFYELGKKLSNLMYEEKNQILNILKSSI